MKKAIFFLLLISTISINAQTAKTITKTPTSAKSVKHEQKVDSLLSKIDTLLMINNQLLEHLEINSSLKGRYKLYQTDNIPNRQHLYFTSTGHKNWHDRTGSVVVRF